MKRFFIQFLRWPGCPKCENLVSFALDGLPESEQERVRKHLERCPACREQVKDFVQVTEGLAQCCPESDAPADFDAKVLARIREHATTLPLPPTQSRSLGAWPRFWMALGPVFAGMSIIMTLVATSAIYFGSKPSAPAADNELAALSHSLLNDPKAAKIVLASAEAGRGASGSLVVCPGARMAYFMGDKLSRCPKGRNYALWMRSHGQEPQRLARFMVEADGHSVHLLNLPEPLSAQGQVDFMVKQEQADQAGETWLKGSVRL